LPALKKINDTTTIISLFDKNKIVAGGKEWDALKYCNEETISNPDQLEAFSLNDQEDELVILCSGTLDGEENVVSIFSKKGSPKTKRLRPVKSSSRISDKTLIKAVEELLKK